MIGSIKSKKSKKSLLRKRTFSDMNRPNDGFSVQDKPLIKHAHFSVDFKRRKITNKETLWEKCAHYVLNKLSRKIYSFIFQDVSIVPKLPEPIEINLQKLMEIENVEIDNIEQPIIQNIQDALPLQQQVVWAHGSSSATLIGASFTGHKLYASGQMMQLFVDKGVMPFTGTFDGGSNLAGVNQAGLSGVTHHTAYRLSDAWGYANKKLEKKSEGVFADSLIDALIAIFEKIKSSKVISEELISQYCRSFGRLKIWDKSELMQWVDYRNNLKNIKKIHRVIFKIIESYQNKLERAFALLGDEVKLKSFMQQVATKLKTFTQKDHESLMGKHRFGFKANPQELLMDVIYILMRKQRLIYTPRQRKTMDDIVYKANSLYSFGGWPAAALANSVTGTSDAIFEAQCIAVMTGYIVTHSQSVRKTLGRENLVENPDRYSHQTMSTELLQLQKRLDRYQAYIYASLDFEYDVVSYTQAQKNLVSQQLPILFCATQMHPDMCNVKHESIWAANDGIALGADGIDVLLTDTVEHQAFIQDYLTQQNLEHDVSVGVYKS